MTLWIGSRSPAETVSSNPVAGIDVCWECRVLSGRRVSLSSWLLVQRNPIDCDVSECNLETSRIKRPWPPLDRRAIGVKSVTFYKGKATTLKNENVYIILKFLILLREMKKMKCSYMFFYAYWNKKKSYLSSLQLSSKFYDKVCISSPKRSFCDGRYNIPLTVCWINCLWNEFWMQWHGI